MGKYAALRTISLIFKILAIVGVIFGLLGAIVSFGTIGSAGVWSAVLSIVYGVIAGLYFFAISQIILVFLDIEDHTRQTEENTRQTEINTHQTNELLKNFLNRQS